MRYNETFSFRHMLCRLFKDNRLWLMLGGKFWMLEGKEIGIWWFEKFGFENLG